MKHEQAGGGADGLGVNIRSVHSVITAGQLRSRSIVVVAVLMLLMMFAVHCTWVTSNAYSCPSIVLASYGNDGSRQVHIGSCVRY
jgi:dolichyl-diphosphooligosaccharide--protein glycosyltransferase